MQGPAPKRTSIDVIPFITTYTSNFDTTHIVKLSEKLLKNTRNEEIKNNFNKSRQVSAYKQPKNILRHLTAAKFETVTSTANKQGLFKCQSKKCQLCKLYIQECSSFVTSNNIRWYIKGCITCNSLNIIYFLKCLCCNKETYTGRTNNLRSRMNQHISEMRSGVTSDRFDRHVFQCKTINNRVNEPFFEIYTFIKLPEERLLVPYESYFHSLSFDTMN